MSKRRLTITVDQEVAAAGAAAVAEGRAASVSAWVNAALAEKAVRDRRLATLAEAVAAYESEWGVIDDDELVEQARADRDAAAAVRVGRPDESAA